MENKLSEIETNLHSNPWTVKGVETIKKCFAPTLSSEEFKVFLGLGKSLNANPFTREIWAVKYGNQAAAIFCGRDFYRRKAQEQEDYDGHIVNAIYENDTFSIENGEPKHVVNSFKDRGVLVGSFCSVYRKNTRVPYFVTIQLKEYNTGKSNWAKMPDTMIKKVAEAQALRGAYQGVFKGTYDESESGVIESSVEEMPTIEQKDYAYNLLRTSAFDDDQKNSVDEELSRDISLNRLNEIIANLKMNQSDPQNMNMKEVNRQIDRQIELEKD